MDLRPYAPAWAEVACRVLETPYPYGAAHTSLGPGDHDVDPARLHPAFHGALDWHSSVHMQWSLVTLLTTAGPELDVAGLTDRLVALLDDRLSMAHLETEVAYLHARPGYERPYGWAWAVTLGEATWACLLPVADVWSEAMSELTSLVADRLVAFLPQLSHPVRHGVHANTAFALTLAHDAFTALGRLDVVAAIDERALTWFGSDVDTDTRGEPSGTDFLSPALTEAQLMRRVLAPADFGAWLDAYLPGLGNPPGLGDRAHQHLLEVPTVSDQTDGQLAHLHGLALSRAWGLAELAAALPAEDRRVVRLRDAARTQLAATLPVVTSGHFMATHWLVSFALLAARALPDA